ncbi:MAG: MgtC/SapB family protein [Candidatus Omnitrophica bacterium]|nr:MgtC/SapB family protein [Candidatus Omnitrophota bacterium]
MEWLNIDFWLKVALCIVCGTAVGLERQLQRKPTDIRTCVLICLGTMTFVYLGTLLAGNQDPTRVLGQVVTGIGFLGAGAIFNREGLVVGLTSASVVWMLAAIGAAVGLDRFGIGITLTLVTLFVLIALHWLENNVLILKKRA